MGTISIQEQEPKLIIIRPLGPQGPKIGLRISSNEDLQRLDEQVGELDKQSRKTVEGIKSAAIKAGIDIIDS